MAAGSLGRLTLDLAVRLSEFTDGLSRAERETTERTENMGAAVAKFKEQLLEDLGGTPIGGAIESLTGRLNDITEAFGNDGLAGAAKIGGLAIAGAFVGATTAIVTMALKTAEADEQLERLAKRGNTSTQNLQVLTAAAAKYGLEMDGVGDILADAQEKLGEFSATGGGGLVDTLERMGKATKMTEDELAVFGNSLSTMDSVDAIQAVVTEMENAGATTQEVRFVTESLASGLGDIIPLWDNNGAALESYDRMLNQAGVIRTKESIEQSKILAQQTQIMKLQFEGLSNQVVTNSLPALSSLVSFMSSGTDGSKDLGKNLSVVGFIANSAASFVIGLATVFKSLGYVIAGVGATLGTFFRLVSNVVRSPLNILSHVNAYLAESGRIGTYVVADINTAALKGGAAINNMWNPATAALVDGRGSVTGNIPKIYASDDEDKAKNTAAVKANTKAITDAKSATHIQYANQSATRNKAIAPELISALSFLQEEGIVFKVTSGGQGAKGSGTKRVGSTAHDNGRAADGDLYKDGRKLDWNNAKDLPLLKSIVEEAAARGVNGIGAGNDYMGAGRFHFGMQGTSAAWGANGKGANALPWVKEAHAAGMQRKASGTFYGKTIAEDAKAQDKAYEDILRRQSSIAVKYATDEEKIESDHLDNIEEIKALYAENSAKYIDYMAREELDYFEKKNAKVTAILVKYLDGEAKITYEHGLALKAIDMANVKDDKARQELITKQNKAYQEDLENFRFAANAKAREQDKLYQSIANSIKANRSMAVNDGMDRMAQRTMSEDDYAVWRLAQDHDESYNSVNTQYAERQSEINAKDERGEFELPELKRFELLEIANQEHLDAMWAMEQDYALKEQNLDKQQAAQRVAIYQGLFSGLTGLTQAFAGEQSTAYRVMFAIEKGFAVAQSVIAIQQSIAKAMAVGFPANIPLVAQSVMQGAQIMSAIKNVQAPSVGGIAHGGLDYVPAETTYLLDKGERVLSPRQNKDLAAFMEKGQQASSGNIVINNNSSAQVTARRAPNGEVTVEMVDKMIEKSFRRIGSPNSTESKSIQRGTTARVNRR